MDKKVIEILKGFDNLATDIMEMQVKIRIGDGPYREASDMDRLELLREEWFKVSEELHELGIDVTEE
jgi:hypothetical protein